MAKKKDEQRLEESARDFERLEAEIAPFLKKRDRKRRTTAGQWQNTPRRIAGVKPGAARPTERT